MTTVRFRVLVLAYALTYVWYFTLTDRTAKLPADMQRILEYSGYGALLPADSLLHSVPFIAAMAGCIGLVLYARWGRLALLASIVAGLAVVPFAGLTITPPLDGFVGAVAGTLGAIVLAFSFSPPIAARLAHESAGEAGSGEQSSQPLSPPSSEEAIEVFRSNDESLLKVLEAALFENDIPFTLVNDLGQDLVPVDGLGSYNLARGPARLFVRHADGARAKEILRELHAPS